MKMSSFVTVFSLAAFLPSFASENNAKMSAARYQQIAPLVEQDLYDLTSRVLPKKVAFNFLASIITGGSAYLMSQNTTYTFLAAGSGFVANSIFLGDKISQKLTGTYITRDHLAAFLSKHNISHAEFQELHADKNVNCNVLNRLRNEHPILWRLR